MGKSLLDYAQEELGFSVPRTSKRVDAACGISPAFDERPQEPTATVIPSVNISADTNLTIADTTTQSNRAVATDDGNTVPMQTSTNQTSTTATLPSLTPDNGTALSGAWRSMRTLEII